MDETYLDVSDSRSREWILPEMCRSWGGSMSIDTYRTYLAEVDGHPWARRQVRTLVLKERGGGELSSLSLHAVAALHDEEQLWLGGIARVITPEPLRGCGYAGKLLRATLDLLKQEGVDGAYLFSDIDPAYYEPFGFTVVNRLGIEALLESLPEPAEVETVRPLQADDWQTVWKIYADAGQGEAFWFSREPEHWDYLLSRSLIYGRFDPERDVAAVERVVVEGGEVTAYAIARAGAGDLVLLEVGMGRPDARLLDLLLGALRSEGERRGCARFVGPWPPGGWQGLFESRFEPTERREGIFMVAPLSARLDLSAVLERGGGSWETDRI